jgi:hypothetical protein
MFKEKIQEGVAFLQGDMKEQIAFGTGELRIYEGAGF